MSHRKDHALQPLNRQAHKRRNHPRQNQLAPHNPQTPPPAPQRLAAHPMPLRRTPPAPTPRQNRRPRRIRKDRHHLRRPNAPIPLARHRRQISIQQQPHLPQRPQDNSLSRHRRLPRLADSISFRSEVNIFCPVFCVINGTFCYLCSLNMMML